MKRNSDYQFVSMDAEVLQAQLISAYEQICGVTVQPASPERLFIQWIVSIIIQERALNNYTGNQNIPSRAEGENLDALAELFYLQERPQARAASCTMRFYISAAQEQAVLIPAGTRVSDSANTLVWATGADAYIPAGDLYIDLPVHCQTAGVIGNGWAMGQINQAVDLYAYYSKCENITVSDGGSDRATDAEFYELLRASQDAYSTAGARGAYIYHAKKVSTEIVDVVANSPSPGVVKLYVLAANGQMAGEELKAAVLAACNDEVRAFTDLVSVDDPEAVSYDVDITYYIAEDSTVKAAEVETAVERAVRQYLEWQSAKLGRDVNPSYLHSLLMQQAGIKRVEIAAPQFCRLCDGRDNNTPQLAVIGNVSVKNGGFEDE